MRRIDPFTYLSEFKAVVGTRSANKLVTRLEFSRGEHSFVMTLTRAAPSTERTIRLVAGSVEIEGKYICVDPQMVWKEPNHRPEVADVRAFLTAVGFANASDIDCARVAGSWLVAVICPALQRAHFAAYAANPTPSDKPALPTGIPRPHIDGE